MKLPRRGRHDDVMDTLAPLLMRLSRRPGKRRMRQVKRRGMSPLLPQLHARLLTVRKLDAGGFGHGAVGDNSVPRVLIAAPSRTRTQSSARAVR